MMIPPPLPPPLPQSTPPPLSTPPPPSLTTLATPLLPPPHSNAPPPASSILIDYIEVTNFKSYAGLVRIGPFHERLTAIIGPNGSGKSNIIDSLLFVFGRRAGQLRQKNLTGLIHNSKDHQPDFARVSIIFIDNIRRIYSFTLCREIHQSGVSKYLIENSPVTYTDMVKFVKSKGIDLDHNRFLILQGEVENLSTLPPKAPSSGGSGGGLLEILEDLFGSDDLIPVIEEKESKCRDLKDALENSDNLLSQANTELTSLVGPCREAYGYINCHKNLLTAKADLIGKELWKLRKGIMKNEDQIKEWSEKRAVLAEHDDHHTLDMAKREWKKALDSLENLNRDIAQSRDSVSKLQLEEDRIAASITSQQRALLEWEKSLIDLQNESEKKEAESQEIIKQGQYWRDIGLKTLKTSLEEITKSIDELDQTLAEERDVANKKLRALTEERDQISDTKLAEIEKQLTEKIKLREIRQKELQGRNLDSLVSKVKDCREKIQEKIAKIDELCVNRDEVKKAVEQRQNSIKKMKARLEILDLQRGELSKKIESANGNGLAVGKTSVLLVRLKNEFSNENSPLYQAGYWLLDYIDCEDIEKFGCALTAGGLGEDIILTNSDEDSEKIIQFVKRNNLGRVTCVTIHTALKKWQHHMQDWQRKKTCPAQSQPLMDFIKVKPFEGKGVAAAARGSTNGVNTTTSGGGTTTFPSPVDISPIIWSRVRDTLLCTEGDIHAAKKIAFGGRERYRMVTYKGEVIEKNGSMTGGSSMNYLKQRKHLFSTRSAADNQSRQALEGWERDHKNCIEEIDKIKFSLRNSTFDDNRVNQQLSEIQRDVNVAISEGKELEKLYGELKSVYQTKQAELKNEENQNKYKNIENNIKILSQEITENEKIKNKIKLNINNLQNQINVEKEKLINIGGVKRSQLQSEKSKLDKEIAARTDLINNMIALSSAAQQRSKQINDSLLPEAKVRVEAAQSELVAKQKALQDSIQLLKEANQLLNERLGQLKDREKELHDSKNLKSEIESRVKALEIEEKRLDNNISDLKIEITTAERTYANKINIIRQLKADFDEFIDFDGSGVQKDEEDSSDETMKESEEAVPDSAKRQSNPSSSALEQLSPVSFPDVEDLARYEDKPTSEFQIQVHKWSENVASLGNTTMDVTVLERFQKKKEELMRLKAERNRRKDDLETQYNDLQAKKQERRQIFDKGFAFLSDKVKELYQMLTRGGDAELEYKACHCPFSEGIEFSVRPSGKSWRSINKLSGGEKTLSSLALIFALHHYKPTPIYILDEIDAALDTQNVILIASYVAACQAANAQFIVISLRHEFFQKADRLIGVCKVHDQTRICVVDPDMFTDQENKRGRDDEKSAAASPGGGGNHLMITE